MRLFLIILLAPMIKRLYEWQFDTQEYLFGNRFQGSHYFLIIRPDFFSMMKEMKLLRNTSELFILGPRG